LSPSSGGTYSVGTVDTASLGLRTEGRTQDNVRDCDSYINKLSSQTHVTVVI
jgi:hypothetical protein